MTTRRCAHAARGGSGVRIAGTLLLGLLVGSCSGEGTGPDLSGPAEVTISPATLRVISLGEQVQFTAVVRNGLGEQMTGVAITWTSSDPAVLTHEGSGRFRSVADGTARIAAQVAVPVDSVVEGTADVTVAQQAASMTLTRAEPTLWAIGQTDQWTASLVDAVGTPLANPPALSWTTSDAAVASVTDGLVTAVADGTAQIRAATGQVNASLAVVVSATVPYELCVSYTAGGGSGPETCMTLTLTIRAN